MIKLIQRIASHLPTTTQQELKRLHFSRQIRRGNFKTKESEFARLAEWVQPGDWVLDIGANVGQYTARFSEIVGPEGRVIAFEPVPHTFELLAANAVKFPVQNISLFNTAASDSARISGISIPKIDSGLDNFYRANLSTDATNLSVLCLPIDSLRIPRRIVLAKLDVEGHELSALKGMKELIKRDKPVLIVEGHIDAVANYLTTFGYSFETDEGSANRVYSCLA